MSAKDLERLANNLFTISPSVGNGDKYCSEIEDSAGIDIVYIIGTDARGVHGERGRRNIPSTALCNPIR